MQNLNGSMKCLVIISLTILCVLVFGGIPRYKQWNRTKRLARYEATVEIITNLLENFDEAVLQNEYVDAWGRNLLMNKVNDSIYIQSLGEDELDEQDDIKAQRIYHNMGGYSQEIFYLLDGVMHGGVICVD